eukprot:TRINITY_DN13002_c2_g5_i1.p1 TRINITY_DN13002_c2_g5~~TRINITY_DN13002_c2_g5_i1.p1  ORF type:complete len:536 (-),score=114.52 TRINITY_DN13002_c2_g5_i1:78-1655(-)
MSAIATASAAIAAASSKGSKETAPVAANGVPAWVADCLPDHEAPGVPLKAEQISAIEAHLHRNGGKDRFSVLRSVFGVRKAQLNESGFTIVPVGDDALVLLPGSKQRSSPASGLLPTGSMTGEVQSVVQGFDNLLSKLRPTRDLIGHAMVFCISRAEKHAALISRRLTASLGENGLTSEAALARLYLVSDVLYNSNSGRPGASQFRTSFQDRLPDSCEQLGRAWLRRVESHLERVRVEGAVKKVLQTWDDWNVFPSLFTKGLEALLFSPVLVTSQESAETEFDQTLKRRLLRWFSAADQARLPYAARLRGLSGKAVPTAACRARLCHFERYWHRPGIEMPEPDEDPFGGGGGSSGSFVATLPSCDSKETLTNDEDDGSPIDASLFKTLHPGASVRLQGFRANPHLDGSVGFCEGFDSACGRWSVRLEGGALQAATDNELVVLGTNAEAMASFNGGNGNDLDGEALSEEELRELRVAGLLPTTMVTRPQVKASYSSAGFGTWTQVDHDTTATGQDEEPSAKRVRLD